MCGEHQAHARHRLRVLGIIPACAGSTVEFKVSEDDMEGSSPHVRGALVAATVERQAEGIIPACAGSTKRSA